MQLNNMGLLGFVICTSLFAILVSLWYTATLITDRELTLIFALFAAVCVTFIACALHSRSIPSHPSDAIHEAQLADANASHRRSITALNATHATELNDLRATLQATQSKFDRLNGEYNWMSGMYQDLMRSSQEQEDRIDYFERKLGEIGRGSPGFQVPISAPSTVTSFEMPPARRSNAVGAPGRAVEAGE
ncbi:hypothetical protein J1614_000010 [Plenodomus biglobosus]|nr:hypothetical protein J1614_000010 [Plenodomus biglobosus]